jgi:hypothetical protein
VIVESKEHTPRGRYDVEDDVALRHRRIDDRDLGLPWHAPSLEEGNAFSRHRLVLAVPPSPPVLCTLLSFFSASPSIGAGISRLVAHWSEASHSERLALQQPGPLLHRRR